MEEVGEEGAAAAAEEAAVAGKLAGLVLLLVGLAASAFLIAGLLEGKLQASGLVLGAILFVLPFLAGGVYILLRSSEEAKAEQRLMREKEILTTIESRGRVKISDLCLDLHLDPSSVQALIRDL
ncbi:MAG: hypothetical protein QHH30_08460, partial [candidate division NC10 bacterium]|nr:hypothetical protein [candidate division NC10 bacterium]